MAAAWRGGGGRPPGAGGRARPGERAQLHRPGLGEGLRPPPPSPPARPRRGEAAAAAEAPGPAARERPLRRGPERVRQHQLPEAGGDVGAGRPPGKNDDLHNLNKSFF